MEWYEVGIIMFSATSVGWLIFIVNLVSVNDDLRIENAKLRIDLRHK